MAYAQAGDPSEFTGLTGWVASVIEAMGPVGVALLVALESIVPPIPSEIVLALAGFLAHEGQFNVVLVVLAATVGSLVGALVLYWLGAALGEERLKRWLDHIPLVDRDDLEKADQLVRAARSVGGADRPGGAGGPQPGLRAGRSQPDAAG